MEKKCSLSESDIHHFRSHINAFYQLHGRNHFAWRQNPHPYAVLVSEIMLQQTQTYRVEPKFNLFMQEFPDLPALASASLRDVLSVWQGLGYNRRGKALWLNAQRMVAEFDACVPSCPIVLQTFDGIGPNTAGSIVAFAYNKPTIFIETNIRAVYLHSFFKDQEGVSDKELLPYIQATVDADQPRQWYYALMDYGVYLKKTMPNPSRKSAHHARQSTFQGSDRQIRGRIIKLTVEHGVLQRQHLFQLLGNELERYQQQLQALAREGMVCIDGDCITII